MLDLCEDRVVGCVNQWECGQDDKVVGAKEFKIESMLPDNHWAWRNYHQHGVAKRTDFTHYFKHRQDNANLEVSDFLDSLELTKQGNC